jgi:hypothetical protein
VSNEKEDIKDVARDVLQDVLADEDDYGAKGVFAMLVEMLTIWGDIPTQEEFDRKVHETNERYRRQSDEIKHLLDSIP